MERLTMEGLKRGGAVALAGFFLLYALLVGQRPLLTVGALAGAGIVKLYFAGNRDDPATWKEITVGAWAGTALFATLLYGFSLFLVTVPGIRHGLILSMLNFGIRGPIESDSLSEEAQGETAQRET